MQGAGEIEGWMARMAGRMVPDGNTNKKKQGQNPHPLIIRLTGKRVYFISVPLLATRATNFSPLYPKMNAIVKAAPMLSSNPFIVNALET